MSRGYPLEIHTVTTEDGYILELHRIPASNRSGRPVVNNPKPVLLMHGIFATSFVWTTGANNNSLGKNNRVSNDLYMYVTYITVFHLSHLQLNALNLWFLV